MQRHVNTNITHTHIYTFKDTATAHATYKPTLLVSIFLNPVSSSLLSQPLSAARLIARLISSARDTFESFVIAHYELRVATCFPNRGRRNAVGSQTPDGNLQKQNTLVNICLELTYSSRSNDYRQGRNNCTSMQHTARQAPGMALQGVRCAVIIVPDITTTLMEGRHTCYLQRGGTWIEHRSGYLMRYFHGFFRPLQRILGEYFEKKKILHLNTRFTSSEYD